jgi:DNA-binding transcriptional ArsR family regulator
MDLKDLEKIHKALANRRRLAILKHLKKRPSATVSALAEVISLSFKSTSKHMIILSAAGLVDREQVNLSMRYHIAAQLPPTAKAVIDTL